MHFPQSSERISFVVPTITIIECCDCELAWPAGFSGRKWVVLASGGLKSLLAGIGLIAGGKKKIYKKK